MCFYEADIMVRVVREYPNPKIRVPEISGTRIFGYCKTRCNFGYRFSKPEILKTRNFRVTRTPTPTDNQTHRKCLNRNFLFHKSI
jgi:hypothetical protein